VVPPGGSSIPGLIKVVMRREICTIHLTIEGGVNERSLVE
jgi:hypothetical protein